MNIKLLGFALAIIIAVASVYEFSKEYSTQAIAGVASSEDEMKD